MKQLFAVCKKEIRSYIDHPMAYILAIVFLVLNAFLFFRSGLAQELATLRAMFSLMPWIFIFFISALTMRAWAEERKEKTLSTLLSYPIEVWKLIVGKFLATWGFVSFIVLLTLFIPFVLQQAGDFDWGVIFSQYLGVILLAGAMVAIGQWVSTLTKNQVVAFILSAAVQTAFILVGLEVVIISLPYPLNTIAQQLGLLSHVNAMSRGVIDLRDVIYFISLILIFLGLAYVWLIKLKSKASSSRFRKLQTTTAILIAIAVVVNLFGQSFTVRADLTEQNLYSLSPATKTLLRDLDDTVRFTLYRSKKLPTQIELVSRDILDLLNDYSKFGGRNVDVSVVYPDDDEDALEKAQANGIPSVQFNVHREDEFTLQEGYLGLVIEYLDQKDALPFVSNINDLEYKLTKSLLSMFSDDQITVGVLSDFGGKTLEELPSIQSVLQENFTVQQITIDSGEDDAVIQPINENIDVLFVAAPTQTYSDEAVEQVKQFVDKGGKVFWLLPGVTVDQQTLNASAITTGFESILEEQGIVIETDLAADLRSHQNVTFGNGLANYILPYPFWIIAGLNQHQLVGNLNQVLTPWASTISFEASETIKPIIETTENTVVQTSGYQLNPNAFPDFSEFEQKPRTLAVSVEDLPEDGRWVIIASEGFIDEQILGQSPSNAGLLINSFDWLAQNEALLSIRTKNALPNVLIWESDGQKQWAVWGNTIGLPIGVALIGLIWLTRRKRLMKK